MQCRISAWSSTTWQLSSHQNFRYTVFKNRGWWPFPKNGMCMCDIFFTFYTFLTHTDTFSIEHISFPHQYVCCGVFVWQGLNFGWVVICNATRIWARHICNPIFIHPHCKLFVCFHCKRWPKQGVHILLGCDDRTTWQCSTLLLCNLQAISDTLTTCYEQVFLGSIGLQLLEHLVAAFTSACPVETAVLGCKLVVVQPKRRVWYY